MLLYWPGVTRTGWPVTTPAAEAIREAQAKAAPLDGAWISWCWACGAMARANRYAETPPPRAATHAFTYACQACEVAWHDEDPVYIPAANLPPEPEPAEPQPPATS
jgi:hypothetical protein